MTLVQFIKIKILRDIALISINLFIYFYKEVVWNSNIRVMKPDKDQTYKIQWICLYILFK
jgi:hypothetical protein